MCHPRRVRQERPSPDALLRELQREAPNEARGRLKVFLGASAGVGKTYAMLSEAHEERARGVDVLIGYVETHGRAETQALLEGLEALPRGTREYRGVRIEEFDLDAALARRPALVLVDELAHTNAPESRHPKRWQDVEELLDAGIDVYTAVNVQHLESLNDAVAQVTGVVVKETVPDAVVERADAIEVVDIPPDALRQRLREGKVYVPDQIEHALEGFFKVGNLMALREMALRRAADRVDAEMRRYRTEQGVTGLWPTRERVVVCVAPNRLASRVVRAAARMAASSHAEPIVLVVESDRQRNRPEGEHEAARQALRLAESLGMETTTLHGHDIVGEIVAFARRRNANLVVVGKPLKARWRELLFGSVVDDLVRRSGEIDVHVITAERVSDEKRRTPKAPRVGGSPKGYAWTLVVTALATGACAVLSPHIETTNLAMVYLLAVAGVASRFGLGEAILASVLGVIVFDVAFVPPRGTLAVSDSQYLITFGVMLLVGLLISRLTPAAARRGAGRVRARAAHLRPVRPEPPTRTEPQQGGDRRGGGARDRGRVRDGGRHPRAARGRAGDPQPLAKRLRGAHRRPVVARTRRARRAWHRHAAGIQGALRPPAGRGGRGGRPRLPPPGGSLAPAPRRAKPLGDVRQRASAFPWSGRSSPRSRTRRGSRPSRNGPATPCSPRSPTTSGPP